MGALSQMVRVDGNAIAEAAIAREMQHHPAASREEARHAALEALVVRQLLIDEAARLGLAVENASIGEDILEDPRIVSLIAAEVKTPDPDEESCRRYYAANRRRFRSPDHFVGRHILLKATPDDIAARDAAKVLARELIAVLQSEPDRFGELARRHSACPSGAEGGALGLVARGDTVPEFETYFFSLGEGELCPLPVESRYGVHVIFLERKMLGQELPFERVHSRIAEYLSAMSWQTAVRQYLLLLAGKARIEGFDLASSHSPLVQ
jgi:peptidyl-prolyl cis-trans isomerase C